VRVSRADKAALDQTDADRAAHSQEVVSYESPYALDREEEITADIAKRLRSGWRLLSIFPMSQSDARWPYCADLAAKLPPKPPPRLLRKRRPAAPLDA